VPEPAVALEAGAKALLYASLLVAIGASAARWLLLPRVGGEIGADGVAVIEQSVARLAVFAAIAALAASGLRVWTHTVAAFGFDGARSWDTLQLIARRSRWGDGWRPQAIAASVLVLASIATVRSRAVWPLATLAAIAFTATIPLLGHASGNGVRLALHTVHILAGGCWLGTLAVVLLFRLPQSSLVWMEAPLTLRQIRLLILRRFSGLALSGAATAGLVGVVAAWLYVGAVTNLWMTAYGRMLVLKVGLVGAVSICGYVNWRHIRRLPVGNDSSMSVIVLETTLAIAVVIVTGCLTEIGTPDEVWQLVWPERAT
jgi:putative copper resistance protein D